MIAALFALAAAMVIGGAAAVVQGFPYVRLESGLAMVIAGSVAASSGAVLFGLGVVASGLRRVERAGNRVFAVPADGPPMSPPGPAQEGRPRLPPVLPAAPAFVVPPTVDPPMFELPMPDLSSSPERPRIEPALPAADHASGEPEPELPIPGLTPAPPVPGQTPDAEPDSAAPPPARTQEDDLFAVPEVVSDAEEPLTLRRSLDAVPEPEAQPPRNVVGRYASGGNTYVMFEDGAIEAETPQGRFTFSSLDELKAFVDGGGEAGTRGAA